MCILYVKKVPKVDWASGGNSWADSIISKSATTDQYIRYKCGTLQHEMAKGNLVVQADILAFKRFRVSVNGKQAFKGNFPFVDRCRAISSITFIDLMERYIRKAARHL